jgi:hypothetical protein
MTASEEIAEALYIELFERQAARYAEQLSAGESAAKIKVYRSATDAFRVLSPEQQNAMLQFFRLVLSDAISGVLATLDGSTGFLKKEIVVCYGGEQVQGELFAAFGERIDATGLLDR